MSSPSSASRQLDSLSVQDPSGKLISTVSLSSSSTVSDLRKALSNIASNTPLRYKGQVLQDAKTLAEYDVTSNSVIECVLDQTASVSSSTASATSTSSLPSPSPSKRSRKRCNYKNCVSAPLRGVGTCGYCQGQYCSKHRLLEQHDCDGLQNCKQQLHERNAVKLQQQQTVANKV